MEAAKEEFEMQGVDLGAVVCAVGGAEALANHPAAAAARALGAAAAAADVGAAAPAALERFAAELGAPAEEGGPRPAAVAVDNDAVEACLAIADRAQGGPAFEAALQALEGLLEVELAKNRFHAAGGYRAVAGHLGRFGELSWETMALVLRTAAAAAAKSEENKCELLALNVGARAVAVLEARPPAPVVAAVCRLMKAVQAADDKRPTPEAFQATLSGEFAKGRALDKQGVPAALYQCLVAYRDPSLTSVVCDTLRRLAVNDDICKHLTAAGIVAELLRLWAENPLLDPRDSKAVAALLRQLANSDDVKKDIAEAEGGLAVVLKALKAAEESKAVAEQILGLLAAVMLRHAEHAELLADAGALGLALLTVKGLEAAPGVQRQACMFVRNAVARSERVKQLALEAGAEAVVRQAKLLHPKPCGDVGSAALRDLGFADYH